MASVKAHGPHPGHENHLCYLHNMGVLDADVEGFKSLVKDAKFLCKRCGRAAAEAGNLCDPIKL